MKALIDLLKGCLLDCLDWELNWSVVLMHWCCLSADMWHERFKKKTYIIRFRYSFICQGASTRRWRSDLFGLQIKLTPVTTSLTTQRYCRGNSIKCLAQGHNKRSCRPISTLIFLNAERQAGKL